MTKIFHHPTNLQLVGQLFIRDAETLELIRAEQNDIHPQNMAAIIARGLAHEDNGALARMAFGNGGTFINSSDQLNFRPPNITGVDASLYNQTYEIQVDELLSGTPSSNSIISIPSPSPAITSLVVIRARLSAQEPAGQALGDNITTGEQAAFIFDEVGLLSADGLLLTHLTFPPVEKTANRAFAFTYTIKVSAS